MLLSKTMGNKEIIEGFLHNDKEVILVCYKQLFPKIKKMVYDYKGDEDDARNMLWKSFAVFRQKCKQEDFKVRNYEAYIYQIARYLWLQEVRKRKDDFMTHHIDYLKIEDDMMTEEARQDTQLSSSQEEVIFRFQQNLKRLPIICQQIIRLKYQYELPHQDIAARYNFSVDSSRKKLSRCLENLAQLINREDFVKEFANYYPGVITYIKKYLKK